MSRLKEQLDRIKPQFEKGGKYAKLHSVFDGFYTFLYTPNTTSKTGVQIHDSNDSKRTMIIVILALLPCCLFGMWNVGYQHGLATGAGGNVLECWWYGFMMTLPMMFVTYIVGLGIEFIFAQIRGHEIQEGFLVSGVRWHGLQLHEPGPGGACFPLLCLSGKDERRQGLYLAWGPANS